MNSADVVTKIKTVFADVRYPGDENIAVDQSGRDLECTEIATAFRGKHWKNVLPEMVREFAQALPLLTPAAFRFFLPAYMIGALTEPLVVDLAKDLAVFSLTPPSPEIASRTDYFDARAKQFTAQESEAIVSFLERMQEDKRVDWAAEGLKPPDETHQRAIAYWTRAHQD